MPGDVVTVRVRLGWSDPAHRADKKAPCRRCHNPTDGRDAQGRAIDQACAEAELAAERAGHRGGQVADERIPSPSQRLAATAGGFR